MIRFKKWSLKDKHYLISNYAENGMNICSLYLKRSPASTATMARKLGVHVSKKRKSETQRLISKKWWKKNPKTQNTAFDPSSLIDITNAESAYLLGYLWADGNIFGKNNQNRISLEIITDDYISIENVVKKTGRWRVYNRRKGRTKFINVNNKMFYDFLKNYDYSIKSKVGAFKILSIVPKELKHYWWRGYFDGDGTVIFNPMKYRKCIKIAGPGFYQWQFIQNLCEEIGIKDYKIRQEQKENGRSSVFVLENYDNIIKFGSYIYQDYDNIGLARKYQKFKDIERKYLSINKRRAIRLSSY